MFHGASAHIWTALMSPAKRQAIADFVTAFLMDAGQYRGFGYLHFSMLQGDALAQRDKPGITQIDTGEPYIIDDSRVFFYATGR